MSSEINMNEAPRNGDSISHHLIGRTYDENDMECDETTEEINFGDLLSESYMKISGYSNKFLRSIKLEIEEVILKKIRALEDIEKDEAQKNRERSVHYLKDFSVDKIGNQVINGQTGISEGWAVPIYKSEFQNLLGLPFTEDHALSNSLRTKKPKQECFNCLSTDHRVTECPVKINNERIAMHRSEFNSQSVQSQDLNMFSTRYTSGPDANLNRGFTPGKLSEQLMEALGCKSNQLPPFIYMMREYGYPGGWLLEAKVNSANKLSVHNGEEAKIDDTDLADGEIASAKEEIEYDQTKIYSYIGFNEKAPNEIIDESDKYRVKRYDESLSRENFLSTLNLAKKKVIKRRSMYQSESQSDVKEEMDEAKSDEAAEEKDTQDEKKPIISESLQSPPAKPKADTMHGVSFNEIPGTPIVDNAKGMSMVPDSDKFSVDICEHRCYEMTGTPSGSYKRIVDLTREFQKAASEAAPAYNDDN